MTTILSQKALGPVLKHATIAELETLFGSSYGRFKDNEAALVKKIKLRLKQEARDEKMRLRQEAEAQRNAAKLAKKKASL